MSLPVFWVDQLRPVPGERVTLSGEEGRHAVTVRRLRVGERLELVDGHGMRALATVTSTAKATLEAEVHEVSEEPAPTPHLTVVQALPKGDRGELAVELLTEVGVDRVVPWAAARCVAVWRGERAEKGLRRWRNTAREAGKQSRRARFPEVTPLATTDEVVTLLRSTDVGVALHEEGSVPLAGLPVERAASLALVVGPEGGLTTEELAQLDVPAVRLGPSVLRTSTAGAAAASALLARTGRWA